MKKEETNIKQVNKRYNSEQPVTPVTATWPPAWLAECSPTDASLESGGQTAIFPSPAGARGWRLPSGAVICADCFSCCSPNAMAVVLVERPEGLMWVDVPQNEGEMPAPAAAMCQEVPEASFEDCSTEIGQLNDVSLWM